MKRVFVSVGTSLFDRALLGPRDAFRPLRRRSVLAAWDDAARQPDAELSVTEGKTRFSAALETAHSTLSGDSTSPDLSQLLKGFPTRIDFLRDAFVLDGGAEDEKKMLSAELASLWRLVSVDPEDGDNSRIYRLKEGDHVVLLATDSPKGYLAGRLLGDVLRDHPALGGAEVEVVWPRHWQAHDGLRLAEKGASNLLAAVSRRIGSDLRARPFFVLTGGMKLGITILSQVSCWSQAEGHDGLFLKLEDPGGVFCPPSSFVERSSGHVLLPHGPKTERLRREVPYTDQLRGIFEATHPPRGKTSVPHTALVVTVGVGLVRARSELLEARFGAASPLADEATWDAVDQHPRCGSWQELRTLMSGAPSDEDLANAEDRGIAQLVETWNEGRSKDLPAELAALRSLWDKTLPAPGPLLRGAVRIVLLTTDSLVGEFCASIVSRFLCRVEGSVQVRRCLEDENGDDWSPADELLFDSVPGFHPFHGLSKKGAYFIRMARIVAKAASEHDRLMILPLGGTKLHLPLLTALATRFHAPSVLGHLGLERPVVVPWLESDGDRVLGASLTEAWPELADLPTVRLEPNP